MLYIRITNKNKIGKIYSFYNEKLTKFVDEFYAFVVNIVNSTNFDEA